MVRIIAPTTLALLLVTIALVGLAPTVSATDDGTSPICTGDPDGEPPQSGLCVTPSDDDCLVWYYTDFWSACIVDRPAS